MLSHYSVTMINVMVFRTIFSLKHVNLYLQIMLSGASRTLSTALDGKAYYKQVTVVVPTSWRDIKCNQEIHTPRSGSSYGVSLECQFP